MAEFTMSLTNEGTCRLFMEKSSKQERDTVASINFDYSGGESNEVVSFHCNNDVRSDNIDAVLAECQDLKPYRVQLFKHAASFLDSIGVPYFIVDGTALAVHRDNGVMIPHDDDVDIAMMEEHFLKVHENRHLLPNHIGTTSDCEYTGQMWIRPDGTEVPYTGYGVKKFIFFDKRDFSQLKQSKEKYSYAVFTDLYTFEDVQGYLSNNYKQPKADLTKKKFAKSIIFPLKRYMFEDRVVPGPNDMKRYLELNYGYLGRDAMWDPKTELYVKKSN